MQGNHTWMPLLTVQEYDLAGLYIGCLLQDLSDTRNAGRYSTVVTLTEIRGSTAPRMTLQLKVIKIKNTMFRRCLFTVSSSFQFVVSCLFLERMVCCSQQSYINIF